MVQLIAYGRPTLLTDAEEVERKGGTIKFHSNTRPSVNLPLFRLIIRLFRDLALVTSMNFYHGSETRRAIYKFEAEILAGSAGLFDPKPIS